MAAGSGTAAYPNPPIMLAEAGPEWVLNLHLRTYERIVHLPDGRVRLDRVSMEAARHR